MTLAEVFALLAFIVSLLLTIMWTTPFLIFIIDVSTQIVKHRKALLSVGFYGILNGRKGAVLQVQRSCFPPDVKSGGSSFLSSSGWFDCTHMKTQRRKSNMEILNIVFSALNLLATVVICVINVTWMISRDVFRDKPRAKHYSKK
jgi:hypothetical protein